jgi:hypothetical protein
MASVSTIQYVSSDGLMFHTKTYTTISFSGVSVATETSTLAQLLLVSGLWMFFGSLAVICCRRLSLQSCFWAKNDCIVSTIESRVNPQIHVPTIDWNDASQQTDQPHRGIIFSSFLLTLLLVVVARSGLC